MPNEDTSSREIQDIPKEAHFLVICHGWAGHAFIGSVYGAALYIHHTPSPESTMRMSMGMRLGIYRYREGLGWSMTIRRRKTQFI